MDSVRSARSAEDCLCLYMFKTTLMPYASAAGAAPLLLLLTALRLGRSQLILVHVAIGLRRQIQRELIVGILTIGLDLDIVQGDDAWQSGNATDELAKLMVAAG